MDKQLTSIKMWHTMCDANVELFRARMNFSAEMFDLYTKWPRQSFSEATEALKAAHLESLKILAEKAGKPAAKGEVKKPAKPAVTAKAKAAPKTKAKPVTAKKAKTAPKATSVAAQPEAKPKAELKLVESAPKADEKTAVAVVAPKAETVAPKPEAATPKPAVEAAKPAVKAGARPVTLPEMPDFTAKPRPAAPADAPKPAETPEKDS